MEFAEEFEFPLGKSVSIVQGPTNPPLLSITLGQLIERQSQAFYSKECIVCSWTGARWTYGRLNQESILLARAMIALGVQKGDRVAIMAGNCEEYASIFFATARIGAILVVINNMYTQDELKYSLDYTEAKVLFTVTDIGRHTNIDFLYEYGPRPMDRGVSNYLTDIVLVHQTRRDFMNGAFINYDDLAAVGSRILNDALSKVESSVSPSDVCNLQFTSGSTGTPKAAMLTHHNLVNNSRFIGQRMAFTQDDILCCPPPLFHCFGLVLGLLTVISAGAKIVLPSNTFSPPAVLWALTTEYCTALHGVPTMFDAILSYRPRPQNFYCPSLRTGIVAGSPVPKPLMQRMVNELGMTEFTSSYGLTETSPTVFNALTTTPIALRLSTVGLPMPHIKAKIIDRNGDIVPLGQRGELCIAGYTVQKGYWQNPEKTAEAMSADSDGVVWLRTGDEALFTDQGYCTITGRFKDIIVRGGENVYPLEIEERLCGHPTITAAAVVGIKDKRYGEVVGAFLKPGIGRSTRPSLTELQRWTRQKLSHYKAPAHVFWLGDPSVGIQDIPTTGSGKVQKFKLRALGDRVVELQTQKKNSEKFIERAIGAVEGIRSQL